MVPFYDVRGRTARKMVKANESGVCYDEDLVPGAVIIRIAGRPPAASNTNSES